MSSTEPIPHELLREVQALAKRHTAEVVSMIDRWPNFRAQIAAFALGSALCTADSMGSDVEECMRVVRATCPRPATFVPPRSS